MARKTKKRAGKAKVVFVNPSPKRRRRRTRRVAVRHNPPKRTRRRRRHNTVLSNPFPRRRHSRHHRNPAPGAVSVGRSLTDGVVSVVEGGVGFFGGLMVNKLFPASMIRYRGAILALVALVGFAKIPNKHARMALLGIAIEGAVDGLRQNVSVFTGLSADDASETIMGISSQRGNPALGYTASDAIHGEDSVDGDSIDGLDGEEELMGAYGSGLTGEGW
jgi:hypothetical protein